MGEGKKTTARTARGAARVLPSGRNILEVIGVCPMSLSTSCRVSREGELNLNGLKKKKPVRFGTGNRCNDEEKHLLLSFSSFFCIPLPPFFPPLALEILVQLGSRAGGFRGCLKIMP